MTAIKLAFLCMLELFSNQMLPAGGSNVTYYAEVIMESTALLNITGELLSVFQINVSVLKTAVAVEKLNITTDCRIVNEEARCTCKENYIWRNDVCRAHPSCCSTDSCIVPSTVMTPTCIPKSRVTITGSITLKQEYVPQLADSNTTIFKNKSLELSNKIKREFSDISGFGSVEITQFRNGSVIADFIVNMNTRFELAKLYEKREDLKKTLKAEAISMETKGFMTMEMPEMPVRFNSKITMSCEFVEVGNITWILKKRKRVRISTGNVANLISEGRKSNLIIKNATAAWKAKAAFQNSSANEGAYECSLQKDDIVHKATGELDIALLPETILKIPEPPFLDCSVRKKVPSKIAYKIKNDGEKYTVDNNGTEIKPKGSADFITYEVQYEVECNTIDENVAVKLLFKNRQNLTLPVCTKIPVIKTMVYCPAENEWPRAKPKFNAKLPCVGESVGHRERRCNDLGDWEQEVSYCVNKELHSLLNDAQGIVMGQGTVQEEANELFSRMKNVTGDIGIIKAYANINTAVNILSLVSEALNLSDSENLLNFDAFQDALYSASNLLNESLTKSWIPESKSGTDYNLSDTYLQAVEGLSKQANTTQLNTVTYPNIEFFSCPSNNCQGEVFNVSVTMKDDNLSGNKLKTVGFKHLADLLRNNENGRAEPSSVVLSATLENGEKQTSGISLTFPLIRDRPRDHVVRCVFWHFPDQSWESDGCKLIKMNDRKDQVVCECKHLTAFSTLMSKYPVELPFLEELTFIGLGVSIFSLTVCIVIELIVWNSIVKSNIAHFRHFTLFNISLCLLMGDCCFLASESAEGSMCLILALLKHFSYLAMFFWTLALSIILLHKLIFIFHQVGRTVYISFSVILGYVCPIIVVLFSCLYYDSGKLGSYYNDDCWLNYDGRLQGSIHSFVLPVGVIVFINLFSLVVVITKLMQPSVSEAGKSDEKGKVKSILKAVVFFTPIFGVTWILGFLTMILDLSDGLFPEIIHYLFTLLNAFQGIFILLAGCFGDKKVRESLWRCVNSESKSARSERASQVTHLKK